jgi:hypothetical protein
MIHSSLHKFFSRLLWLCLIVAIFFIGDRLAASILQRLMLESQFRYATLYRGEATNDILVLGNSRGVNGFYQPDIEKLTGKQALNLSYNALSSGMAKVLLEDYLEHNTAPNLLLLEVSFLAEGEPLTQLTLDNFKPFSLLSTKLQTLQQQHDPISLFFCRVSHLYCFNSEMYLRALYYLTKSDQNWINRYKISREIIDSINEVQPFDLPLPQTQLTTLQELLAVAHNHDITVKLVMSPYFPAYGARIKNMHTWVHMITKSSGLPVLDYSQAVEDVNGFSDRLHLNPKGSLALLQQMVKDGVFNY